MWELSRDNSHTHRDDEGEVRNPFEAANARSDLCSSTIGG